MAIEFRCTQCGKLLRTADATAGKQAKCPSCGTVVTIPQAGSAESHAGSPPSQPQGPEAVTPPAMGDNPYASPRQPAIGSAAATNVSGNMVPRGSTLAMCSAAHGPSSRIKWESASEPR